MFQTRHYTIAFVFIMCTYFAPQCANAQTNAKANTVTNFDKDGKQVTRFSTVGDAIDAHDGEIALFNGVYYLYGTSYDCGFEWGNKNAPFCGFKSYSSTDMVNWKDRGFLFDAQTQVWQTRCNGNTYGCFRPHVIFNEKTGLYVLWINVYDNVSGYRVFTGKSPVGPFTEVAEPKLAVNSSAPAAGLNNGDHDTFVDDDGTAYLAYTDWRTKGSIVIEKLSADYLTGTGEVVKNITTGNTEAPGMFKRNGIYYVVYSDPNCGYCSGTGASYKTAASPLGPWSEGKKISDNSCGGQPSFVSTIKLGSGTVFLFGSDLWNNAAKNEALANYYWAPLTFAADGSINPMTCEQAFKISGSDNKVSTIKADAGFKTHCDISKNVQRSQSFIPAKTGVLTTIELTTFKTGYPDAELAVTIFKADKTGKAIGSALGTEAIPAATIGWSAKRVAIHPKIMVTKGAAYCIVIKSAAATGCYGFAFRDTAKTTGVELYSNDGGKTFSTEKNRELKLQIHFGK
ncbi:Glycosyl hydrolases family 43 [Mucilaginibacter pineti]|uniref:Glycosyl hydrolases family 43 n=1 Tax=Mucilaginibacter pineti TaxID=1391627 RepID=A0A1G6SR77_9SPHI|nr:family 43 glycosylhydrolase [Mucilaginibacter pineti]SDD19343.1 Glycosyl hydrolases family 43 [Mucilaginibacter pineti]